MSERDTVAIVAAILIAKEHIADYLRSIDSTVSNCQYSYDGRVYGFDEAIEDARTIVARARELDV